MLNAVSPHIVLSGKTFQMPASTFCTAVNSCPTLGASLEVTMLATGDTLMMGRKICSTCIAWQMAPVSISCFIVHATHPSSSDMLQKPTLMSSRQLHAITHENSSQWGACMRVKGCSRGPLMQTAAAGADGQEAQGVPERG